jgi:hypothetical protein
LSVAHGGLSSLVAQGYYESQFASGTGSQKVADVDALAALKPTTREEKKCVHKIAVFSKDVTEMSVQQGLQTSI